MNAKLNDGNAGARGHVLSAMGAAATWLVAASVICFVYAFFYTRDGWNQLGSLFLGAGVAIPGALAAFAVFGIVRLRNANGIARALVTWSVAVGPFYALLVFALLTDASTVGRGVFLLMASVGVPAFPVALLAEWVRSEIQER